MSAKKSNCAPWGSGISCIDDEDVRLDNGGLMLADEPAECIEYEGVTKEDLIVSVGRIAGVLSLTDTFETPRFSNGLAKPVLVKMPVGDDSGVEIPLRSVNAEDNAEGIVKLEEPIRGAFPSSAPDTPSCV